jgi:serine/threonine protein phosphatase PrpC/Na+-transporting methylmalonyl-CoA/oxaloacetate decarboxylase gamma subunit
MSTQCFMSHVCKHPGRFAFTVFVGALLALQCLLPCTAFARSRGEQTATVSPSTQQANYLRDKVGVSVVRLEITYGDASLVCTGLGILVASVPLSTSPSTYQNWVLTDANLLKAQLASCGGSSSGTSDGVQPLKEIRIWASDEYAQSNSGTLLDDLTNCTRQSTGVDPLPQSDISVACNDTQSPTSARTTLAFSSTGQVPYQYFTFFSSSGEPYLTPDLSNTSTGGVGYNIGLTNGSGKVFPFANAKQTSQALPQDYLAPSIVQYPVNVVTPTSVATSSSNTIAPLNTIESGTPLVSASGQLMGMAVNNGDGPMPLRMTFLQTLWTTHILPSAGLSVTSPSACTQGTYVAACWNAGIDAFYGAPSLNSPRYALAQSYFTKLTSLNARFKAPQAFGTQAARLLKPPTVPVASHSSSIFSLLSLVGLGVILLVLIVLLVLVTLLAGRVRKRRRELARFANEQLVAQRLAEEEVNRQRKQQAQGSEMLCPSCHRPVRLGDTLCPSCRFPLAPSASGISTQSSAAPLPPSALPISERPTIQFPPAPAGTPNGGSSEITQRRMQPVDGEKTVYQVQRVRGRNLSLAVGTRSDRGIKRKHKPNEDSLFAMQGARTNDSQPQQFGLFVVADGMGGHANGQDASLLAIQTMIDFMLPRVTTGEQMSDEDFLRLLSDGVQHANQAVHARNLEERADMGTTMTTALVVGATAYIANVGDSRTYLYREGQGLRKITNDHSVVASLVEAGIIQPDDIYTHPKRNQIYRSLGEKPVVEVDTFSVDLQAGDKLLLCSDGLWDMVRDPLIQRVLSKPNDPDEIGKELIKAALDGGGEDNVSVIIAQFSEMDAHTGLTGVQLLAKPEGVTVPDLPVQ